MKYYHRYLFIFCFASLLTACEFDINANYQDTDGDGTPDLFDKCALDPDKIDPGVCGCGLSDDGNVIEIHGQNFCLSPPNDDDSDRDGVRDTEDGCPNKPFKYAPDVCGCDRYDIDHDKDGVIDACERLATDKALYMPEGGFPDQCGQDPDKIEPGACGCGTPDIDTDNDGTLDCHDECPLDPDKTEAGVCGCQSDSKFIITINDEAFCGFITEDDRDGDGMNDDKDQCADKPFKYMPGVCGCERYDLDMDKDSVIDACEKLEGDNEQPYTPENGFPDTCPEDPDKYAPGICGCGTPDEDEDGDGHIFCSEGHDYNQDNCPDDPAKAEPGVCGCGTPDEDDDEDGYIFCSEGHDYNQDACPEDPDKHEAGVCGCGTPDNDSDGDGTPDCIDECPYDPLQTEPGTCGCNIHAIIEEGSDKAVCPKESGLLSLDTMFPKKNNHVEHTSEHLLQHYETRTTPNHDLYAYFIPGGNLLENKLNEDPCLTEDSLGMTKNRSSERSDEYRGEIDGPRPFPQHCVFIFHDDITDDNRRIAYTFKNPYNKTIPLRMGVLGASTYKGTIYSFGIRGLITKDTDAYDFTLATTKSKDPLLPRGNYTVSFTADNGNVLDDGTGHNSAAIQGFQVFFGNPEIRFLEQKSDGQWTWTEWETYDDSTEPNNDHMWRRRVILPEGYGKRCVYMQTRNETLPPVDGESPTHVTDKYVYYETSNCIDVKEPNRDAHLQVQQGEVKPNEDVAFYYLPGTNMLNDYDFAKSEENPWAFDGEYKINRESEAPPARTFTHLPELVMEPGASASHWVKLPDPNLEEEFVQVSFWTDAPDASKIKAIFTMYDDKGIVLKDGIKNITKKNDQKYASYYLDSTLHYGSRQISLQIKNEGENAIGIQAPRIGVGRTYVRFSNNRQYWSRWEDATGVKTNWKFEKGETIQSEYDCPPSDESKCTVFAQFTDAVTRAYSEASAVVEF